MSATEQPTVPTLPQGTDRTVYLAEHLAPTPRNIASATAAVAVITAAGWEPVTGYPGADLHWKVRCLLCGWEGLRFYSHLRRGRPVFRHDGCLPAAQQAAKLAELTAQPAPATCTCVIAHPTTSERAGEVLKALAEARQAGDPVGITLGLAQLLSPCPAFAARRAALEKATTA